jgi:hypothetical protein
LRGRGHARPGFVAALSCYAFIAAIPNAEHPIERRAYLPTFPEELRNAGQ